MEVLTGSRETAIRLRFVHDQERGRSLPDAEGTVAALWPTVIEAQAGGFGVFYFLNVIKPGPGTGYNGAAKDVDVAAIRVLAIDCDEGLPDAWEYHVPPAILVHTSPGKGQALWPVPPGMIKPDEFKQAQRRLVAYYGSDKATVNASRVFRLPGSLHQKREPHLVKFDHQDVAYVDPREGLPNIPPPEAPSAAVGQPVKLEHLREILGHISPDVPYPDWRDRIGAIRNTPAGTEDERRRIAQDWSQCDRLDPNGVFDHTWDTMPPKAGGVGYGTLLTAASKGGYRGQSAAFTPLAERFKPFDPWRKVSDTLKEQAPPLVDLVPGLIEQGICTFLAAPGGMNKSRLAVQWGLCIDAGLPIWGRQVRKAQFIYLSYEDRAGEVTRRMQTIARRLHLPAEITARWRDFTEEPAPLATISDDVVTTDFYDELRAYLLGITGPKFVVLDSTYDVLRFVGAAKVNETAVHDAIRLLDRLCIDTDSSILCLWHPSRSGMERGDASGWSVAWENAPRGKVSIAAVKDAKDTYTVAVQKRNNTAKIDPITVHWADGILLPYSEAATDEITRRFHSAVIEAAIALYVQGTPIQRRGSDIPSWVWGSIERVSGKRPTMRELKAELADALNKKELRYVTGQRGEPTGYYPPDGWGGPTDTTPTPGGEQEESDKW